jgi:YVTN family beta-propeller protein
MRDVDAWHTVFQAVRRASASLLLVAVLAGCGGGSHDARSTAKKPRVVAKIRTGQDTGVVAAYGSVWTADHREGTVSRIDVATNRVMARIPIGELPYDVTAGGGAVWAPAQQSKRLVRIDPKTNRVTASVRGTFDRLAFGAGAVWVIEWPDAPSFPDPWRGRYVTRIDASSAKVVTRIELPGPSESVAFGEGAVWSATKGGWLVRIDPGTNRIVGKIKLPVPGEGITVGEGAVWVGLTDGRVARLDPASERITATVRTGTGHEIYLDAGEGAVWAGNVNNIVDSTLSRIDPASARVTATIPIGDGPQGLAVGYGSIWVESFEEGRVWRIRP